MASLALRFIQCAFIYLLFGNSLAAQVDASTPWTPVTSSDGSTATARHEASAVAVGNNFYLLGGRGNRPLEIFDTVSRTWRNLGRAPIELHHFQPVVIGQKIYALGAFTCCYPNEPSVADIYVFDTVTEQWSTAGVVPEARRRGAAAAVVYNGDIYLLGGNTLGHNGGAVPWFDRYDPQTGTWEVLADAPNARDHFAAAVINGRLVAAAGRRTVQPNPFVNPVLPTDIYNFANARWNSGANIPTPRAGTMIAAADNELLVAGGEINTTSQALRTTEAYNVLTNQWRSLQLMIEQRHSGGGAVVNDIWHVVAGSDVQGGPANGELNSHESLDLSVVTATDTDDDGLSDNDETTLHDTDPADPDSDDDQLLDGFEVMLGSNPLNEDTDSDGLNDGDEVDQGTDFLDSDSDDDGLEDGQEIALGSDPLNADSDSDGLDDAIELSLSSDLLNPDTDEDGLTDGAEVNTHGSSALSADTDSDQLDDHAEVTQWMTNPTVADSDEDGLDDGDEVTRGTSPNNADGDGDGLSDGVEVMGGTMPDNADSDADGLADGAEITAGTNPLEQDSDSDGLDDGAEITAGTDPLEQDSDSDGLHDGAEIEAGTDPLDQDTDGDGMLDAQDAEPLVRSQASSDVKNNSGLGVLLWLTLAMGVVALSRKLSASVK